MLLNLEGRLRSTPSSSQSFSKTYFPQFPFSPGKAGPCESYCREIIPWPAYLRITSVLWSSKTLKTSSNAASRCPEGRWGLAFRPLNRRKPRVPEAVAQGYPVGSRRPGLKELPSPVGSVLLHHRVPSTSAGPSDLPLSSPPCCVIPDLKYTLVLSSLSGAFPPTLGLLTQPPGPLGF